MASTQEHRNSVYAEGCGQFEDSDEDWDVADVSPDALKGAEDTSACAAEAPFRGPGRELKPADCGNQHELSPPPMPAHELIREAQRRLDEAGRKRMQQLPAEYNLAEFSFAQVLLQREQSGEQITPGKARNRRNSWLNFFNRRNSGGISQDTEVGVGGKQAALSRSQGEGQGKGKDQGKVEGKGGGGDDGVVRLVRVWRWSSDCQKQLIKFIPLPAGTDSNWEAFLRTCHAALDMGRAKITSVWSSRRTRVTATGELAENDTLKVCVGGQACAERCTCGSIRAADLAARARARQRPSRAPPRMPAPAPAPAPVPACSSSTAAPTEPPRAPLARAGPKEGVGSAGGSGGGGGGGSGSGGGGDGSGCNSGGGGGGGGGGDGGGDGGDGAQSPARAHAPTRAPAQAHARMAMGRGSRLKLHQLLGQGGSSKVYAGSLVAADGTTTRVAVKQIHIAPARARRRPSSALGRGMDGIGAAGAESVETLEQEIKMLSTIRHRHVIGYYGVFRPRLKAPSQRLPAAAATAAAGHSRAQSEAAWRAQKLMVIMEYCAQGSLEQVLRRSGQSRFEAAEVRRIVRQVLLGLQYLHSKGVMHRDIKPSNILQASDGSIKISDFDCATQCAGLNSMKRTCVGTPYYIAPEVVLSEKSSFPADVWSLGCTVLHLATGSPPFGSLKGVIAMYRMVERPATEFIPAADTGGDARSVIDGVEGLDDFLMKCWRRRPGERPTAHQLLEHPFLRAAAATSDI